MLVSSSVMSEACLSQSPVCPGIVLEVLDGSLLGSSEPIAALAAPNRP